MRSSREVARSKSLTQRISKANLLASERMRARSTEILARDLGRYYFRRISHTLLLIP